MFASKTLFILGAGASAELGLPTGATLSQMISERLNFNTDSERELGGESAIVRALHTYSSTGETDFLSYLSTARMVSSGVGYSDSIDEFLNKHEGNKAAAICAKLAIAHSIIDAENGSHVYVDITKGNALFQNPNLVAKSWMLRFVKILFDRVQRDKINGVMEQISVINFNYDRCLEHYLLHSLMDAFGISQADAVLAIHELEIVRPYGSLGKLLWQDRAGLPYGGRRPLGSNDIFQVATHIRTFYEQTMESEEIDRMQDVMASAERIVFLGFGFHPQNMRLLTPRSGLKPAQVYATAYGESASGAQSVRGAIRKLLHRGGQRDDDIYIERKMKCSDLLNEYARQLTDS